MASGRTARTLAPSGFLKYAKPAAHHATKLRSESRHRSKAVESPRSPCAVRQTTLGVADARRSDLCGSVSGHRKRSSTQPIANSHEGFDLLSALPSGTIARVRRRGESSHRDRGVRFLSAVAVAAARKLSIVLDERYGEPTFRELEPRRRMAAGRSILSGRRPESSRAFARSRAANRRQGRRRYRTGAVAGQPASSRERAPDCGCHQLLIIG
jgi:hypothetical protein